MRRRNTAPFISTTTTSTTPAGETDFTYAVPAETPSGLYAARLRGGGAADQEEYVPFYVRAPAGDVAADIVFLAPTASYMAYANYRLALHGGR